MEILTLLRANVKRKKGTFFGILFLMILVAALLTMLFSIKKNVTKSIDEAYIEAKAGDVFMNIPAERLTPELLNSVKEHPLVDHVETMDAILMRKRYIRGKEDNESWLIVPLNDVVTHQFADDSFSSYQDHVDPLHDGIQRLADQELIGLLGQLPVDGAHGISGMIGTQVRILGKAHRRRRDEAYRTQGLKVRNRFRLYFYGIYGYAEGGGRGKGNGKQPQDIRCAAADSPEMVYTGMEIRFQKLFGPGAGEGHILPFMLRGQHVLRFQRDLERRDGNRRPV